MKTNIDLRGISVPAATPFNADESLVLENVGRNLEWWNRFPLKGYLILGSTGEPFNLTRSERRAVITAAREAIPSSRVMMVGTGQQTTRETIDLTKEAASIGADVAVVVTPFYYRGAMTSAALLRHYQSIADASPIPVVLYNIPMFTGVTMDVATIARLAEHSNIIGLKDSTANSVGLIDTFNHVPADFQILWGNPSTFYGALRLGAAGGILAAANFAPDLTTAIFKANQTGEHEQASQLQRRLAILVERVLAYGLGGVKAALEIRGCPVGPPRAPLAAPDENARAVIRQALVEAELL